MPEATFYYKNPAAPRPNKPPILGACAIIQYRSTYLMASKKRRTAGLRRPRGA